MVEHGLTVGGKSLVEHLEAINHAQALNWVKAQQNRSFRDLQESDLLHLHGLILKSIDDGHSGCYRAVPVRISGSAGVLPNPLKVPDLMQQFMAWLNVSESLHPVERAMEAHYRLVTIHPFVDGNGRTARLLMNMLLLMEGYMPGIVRKQDRLAYLTALEKAQLGGSKESYSKLMARCVERSLDICLKHFGQETTAVLEKPLLKIGTLAKQLGEVSSTLRYWTKQGLLIVADVTPSGYQLYDPSMLERIDRIRELQKRRLNLEEIRSNLDAEE